MFSPTRKRSESTAGVVDLDMTTDANTTVLSSGSLDELLSPVPGEDGALAHRDSLADSVVAPEPGEEDMRFSLVPLSGSLVNGSNGKESKAGEDATPPGASSPPSAVGPEKRSTVALARRGSDASPRASPTVSSTKRHKKAASSYTSTGTGGPRASIGNLPFLLQRLDLQRAQKAEVNANGAGPYSPRRVSTDGQQRLQEEFVRIHNGAQVDPNDEDSEENAIDWGMRSFFCLYVYI